MISLVTNHMMIFFIHLQWYRYWRITWWYFSYIYTDIVTDESYDYIFVCHSNFSLSTPLHTPSITFFQLSGLMRSFFYVAFPGYMHDILRFEVVKIYHCYRINIWRHDKNRVDTLLQHQNRHDLSDWAIKTPGIANFEKNSLPHILVTNFFLVQP